VLTFSSSRRRRVSALAAASIIAALFAGCGGGDDKPNDPAGVAKQYVADVSNKDWKGACKAFSKAALAQVTILQNTIQAPDCATTLKTALTQPGNTLKKVDAGSVTVTKLKVNGDKATADVSPSVDKNPTTYLVKEGGQWKIDADPAPKPTNVGGDSGATGPTGQQGTTTQGSG
jgi:hypothetical protein